jgi:hypothetical protein
MSLPQWRDCAPYAAATRPARHGARRWPRAACFAAALIASLALWIALFKVAAQLLGF